MAVRAGLLTPNGILSFDVGSAFSSADDRFFTIEGSLEIRVRPRGRVTPFAAAGVGALKEPRFTSRVVRLSAGVDVNMGRTALRAGAQRGDHGVKGPHVLYVGIERRFGRWREGP
jgi:hypothetical protein